MCGLDAHPLSGAQSCAETATRDVFNELLMRGWHVVPHSSQEGPCLDSVDRAKQYFQYKDMLHLVKCIYIFTLFSFKYSTLSGKWCCII